MDNLRNIISNLYIYKFANNDNISMNQYETDVISEESPSNMELNNENTFIQINEPSQKGNDVYENNKIDNEHNKPVRNPRLDNYNEKYISIKKSNFLKNEVNYIAKNKELLRSMENQMKILKLKKENEALNLLLSNKSKNYNGVKSKLMDYELKQKKNKNNLLKKNRNKSRNFSSQKPFRKIRNFYENNNANNYEYEYEPINEYQSKPKNIVEKNLKLPPIKVKPSSSPTLDEVPQLHKDYGKMPEYLEKRKKELQDQKEQEDLRQKETKLPSGYKILTEEERLERLNNLNERRKELEEELCKLPIAILTEKQKKRKAEIDKELIENQDKTNKLIGYKEVIVKE